MFRQRQLLSASLTLLCVLGVYVSSDALIGTSSTAQDAPLSMVRALPAVLENQEMRIVEVVLAPGEASPPHRHNAFVYVYVLEGEVEMQVKGAEPVRLHAGDTFYETPIDIHVLGRNLSATKPARFLVHMLKEIGAPAYVEEPK